MDDLALASFFIGMLMIPCYLAWRTVRGKQASRGSGDGIFATAETFLDGDATAVRFEPTVDRKALAIQRSREIYLRTGGRPPQPDYRPLAVQDNPSVSKQRNRRSS